jgi:HSP20 family protein
MAEAAKKLPVKTSRPTVRRSEVHRGSRPVEQLRTEVDRLLSDFLRGYWHVPFRRSVVDVEPYWRGEIAFGATPAVDIVEKDDGYRLTAELPGVDEQGVEIKFSEGSLTIQGQKEEDKDDEKQDHFLSERRYGAFHRSFRVPDGVDADKIEASFKNGVLIVALPKTAEARKQHKTIAVKKA